MFSEIKYVFDGVFDEFSVIGEPVVKVIGRFIFKTTVEIIFLSNKIP
jgi:hypothetical protein